MLPISPSQPLDFDFLLPNFEQQGPPAIPIGAVNLTPSPLSLDSPPIINRPFKKAKITHSPEKSPAIGSGITGLTMKVNGIFWTLEPLTKGNEGCFHDVFAITDPSELSIKGKTIPCSAVVLKCLKKGKPSLTFKDRQKRNLMKKIGSLAIAKLETNSLLQKLGLRTPTIYLKPEEALDASSPGNGNFWLIERMTTSISCHNWGNGEQVSALPPLSQKVLQTVKNVLAAMVQEKREIISDFYPRNLMFSKEEEIVVVDFDLTDDDWQFNLFEYALAWSNRNHHVWKHLCEGLPQNILKHMDTLLDFRQQSQNIEKESVIPHSPQTHWGCCEKIKIAR